MNLFLTPRAEADIDSACVYFVREADIETAIRFFDSASESFERLRQSPYVGVEREFSNDLLNRVRMWFVADFDRYLIFYRIFEDRILVIRVVHSARDVEKLIAEEEE